MDKLKMESLDMTQVNIEKIEVLFPSVITEANDENGKLKKAVNFELLKQILSDEVQDGDEAYEFSWVGKKAAIVEGNKPIRKTLRPCKEESKNWDTTENLYIEGDNLDVLKLLQESYLGQVKMIYIDPPYNTGNDFIYKDNFTANKEDYEDDLGLYDEDENRLFQNNESNGRFHSDWCSMIYPRLHLARNLLTDDGVIFISIDDNEVENLKKMCDEVFGEDNFVGMITWSKKRKGSFLSKGIISLTEYLLVFTKSRNENAGIYGGEADSTESQPIIKRTNNVSVLSIPYNSISTKLQDGLYNKGIYGDEVNPVELLTDAIVSNGLIANEIKIKAPFVWSQRMFDDQLLKGAKFVINTMNFQIRVFKIYADDSFKGFPSYLNGVEIKGTNEDAYEDLEKIFKVKKCFIIQNLLII